MREIFPRRCRNGLVPIDYLVRLPPNEENMVAAVYDLLALRNKRNPDQRSKEKKMRFMVMVKATKSSEAGVMPDEKLLADMTTFNEELARAGIMLSGDGLHPSSKGARVKFSADNRRTVVDGPFAETKELVAGFWIWKVKSRQEALDWVKRCPSPMPGEECEIELRQIFEAEDFGAEYTPELREREERLTQQTQKNK